jgi:hypothetical protein
MADVKDRIDEILNDLRKKRDELRSEIYPSCMTASGRMQTFNRAQPLLSATLRLLSAVCR